MIKYLIKRSGKKVKFDPSKLNKLASWASDHGVEWSGIALDRNEKTSRDCNKF